MERNEVINGIARCADRIQIGLVPLGTGNDFARTLALPDSIEDCVQILRTGKTRAIDLVRVTSDQVRYFVNVSAGGFSGTVDVKLTPEIKEHREPLAYLRSTTAALPELRSYRPTVVWMTIRRSRQTFTTQSSPMGVLLREAPK